jgi:hypothetical protein
LCLLTKGKIAALKTNGGANAKSASDIGNVNKL